MLVNVPLDQIDDNPFQRRQDYGDVETLAQDIQKRGLLQIPRGRLLFDGQPVDRDRLSATLDVTNGYPYGESFRVQLAFGHRRLRAFRHLDATGAGWNTIPIYIEAMTDDAMLDAVWSENQHRSDINAIEQAELLAEKLERARAAGGNQTTVAAEWNLDRSTIANKIRLLELPADVQTSLRERRLSERQALALLPVLELEQKINGAAVEWGSERTTWLPMAPSKFITHVLEKPEESTSDVIRMYTKAATNYAGRPLSDDLATFDAGEGPSIIQAVCKGCPKRHNQSCLYMPCYDARMERFTAALPEWAARETGLPYSDNAADFDYSHAELPALQADWEAGRHDTLVVGIRIDQYYPLRPYAEGDGYVYSRNVTEDWKRAVVIGRKAGTTAEAEAHAGGAPSTPSAPLRPSDGEIKRWKALAATGDRERVKRTQQALLREIAPLAENEPAMRALLAMLDPSWLKEADEVHRTPTAHEFAAHLLEQVWKRAQTWHYGGTNRDVMRKLLHRAAISPDIVDPPDRALRLLDIGQAALLRYEETRNHVGTDALYKRLALVRDALAEFDAAQSAVDGNEELQQLAAYLRAAEEREEKILADFAVSEDATSRTSVVAELPAAVEASS